MPYSIDASSADCYEGTTVLINKLGIKDEKQLEENESFITLVKSAELETHPLSMSFDFDHYKAVHKYLFEDLYDWAGTVRTINFSKKNTVFCPANEIERIGTSLFEYLKSQNYFETARHSDFSKSIAEFYHEVNMLHPFREGNGRTQRAFFTQLIRHAGYDINFKDADMDMLMIATIHAANGVSTYLIDLFSACIIDVYETTAG